jgi:PadR family transcriptional regulator PadR
MSQNAPTSGPRKGRLRAITTPGVSMRANAGCFVARLHGFSRIKGGTLYPLLKPLEDQGLVEHTWQHDQAGPGRKQFKLTELGRQKLERSGTAWRRMSEAHTEIQTTRREQP